MPAQQRGYVETVFLTGTTGPVTKGYILCYTNSTIDRFVVATTANLALYGQNPSCIACTAADNDNPAVEAQYTGFVPKLITLLGTGPANDPICVDANGKLARGSSPVIVGKADAEGNAHINLSGIGVGGTSPATPGGSDGDTQYRVNATTFGGMTPGVTGRVLRATSATAAAYGQLDLANANAVTGILPLANGGTGQNFSNLAGHSLQVVRVNVGETGLELATVSTGAAPGGSDGDTQYRVNATTFGGMTPGATGRVLRATSATAAAYGQLDLANASAITGVLPLANQAAPTGTGFATVTSGAWDAAALAQPLSIAKGGTNNSSAPTTNAIIQFDGTRYTIAANLTSDGTGLVVGSSGYVKAGAGTVATVATVRHGNTAANMWAVRRADNAADLICFAHDGSNLMSVGCDAASSNAWSNLRMFAVSTTYIGTTSGINLELTTTEIGLKFPCRGSGDAWKWKSLIYTQGTTSTKTLSASESECPIIVPQGAAGGTFIIVAPTSTNAVYHVRNENSSVCSFQDSGGTPVSVGSTSQAIVWHNGTDYVLLR